MIKNQKFHIGDRVRLTVAGGGDLKEYPLAGLCGVIKTVSDYRYGVRFDENFGGHSLAGHAEKGHGWWCDADTLDFEYPDVEPDTVITMDTDELL